MAQPRVPRCLGSPPLLFHPTDNKFKCQRSIIQTNNKFHPSEHHGPGSNWAGECEGHFQPGASSIQGLTQGGLLEVVTPGLDLETQFPSH